MDIRYDIRPPFGDPVYSCLRGIYSLECSPVPDLLHTRATAKGIDIVDRNLLSVIRRTLSPLHLRDAEVWTCEFVAVDLRDSVESCYPRRSLGSPNSSASNFTTIRATATESQRRDGRKEKPADGGLFNGSANGS